MSYVRSVALSAILFAGIGCTAQNKTESGVSSMQNASVRAHSDLISLENLNRIIADMDQKKIFKGIASSYARFDYNTQQIYVIEGGSTGIEPIGSVLMCIAKKADLSDAKCFVTKSTWQDGRTPGDYWMTPDMLEDLCDAAPGEWAEDPRSTSRFLKKPTIVGFPAEWECVKKPIAYPGH